MSVLKRHPRKNNIIRPDSDTWIKRTRRRVLRDLFPNGYVLVAHTDWTQVFPNPKAPGFRRRKR